MDFFSAQDAARRKTWQLAALFAIAVAVLVVLTNLLVALVYAWTPRPEAPAGTSASRTLATFPAEYWLWISLGVVGVVGLGSLHKYLAIRGGGRAVAESMGGRLLSYDAADTDERRLLNVVEEMAIAAGMPVPPVYLIDEPSINAFAAGFSTDDAVIGINRGAVEHLSRDELQGIVGHELSHLLNGDSRINLRLIAVLHGILFLGVVGRSLLYGAGRRGARRSRSSGGAPILILALGLLVIGYTGTFFGHLIKAAVSRQRELLADAASVQFTRNPHGIAGALKKIGGLTAGSSMSSAAAGEASHMLFGPAGPVFLNRLLSTHPPLETRIAAVDPQWDGRFPDIAGEAGGTGAPGAETASAFAGPDTRPPASAPERVVEHVGRLDDEGLGRAAALVQGLPEALRAAAHDPFAARALMYTLVLDAEPGARRDQLDHVKEHGERSMAREVERLMQAADGLDERQSLTLIEMAMPALKSLSQAQYQRFVENLIALIKADQRIDLMEWVLHRLLVQELKPHFEGTRRLPVRHRHVGDRADDVATLLSALARQGADAVARARAAFAAGLAELGIDARFDERPDPNFVRLNRALAELRVLAPLEKPRLVKACAATVLDDGRVSPRQGALLQGVAAVLDCPLPPSVDDA
ncbi:MAG: M48 family metallopeptidase [Pseudomonadota bacterium]